MDISKVIKATEDLLYELALWPLLIPKTLFRVVARPSWIPQYVLDELRKPSGDRFDAYMPPLIFFVIVAIIPNLLANAVRPDLPYNDFLTRRTVVGQMARLSDEHRFLLYSVQWMFLPLSYTLLHLISSSREIARSTLKPVFYAQCFRIAPLSIFFIARFLLVIGVSGPHSAPWLPLINWATVLLVFGWLVFSEVPVAAMELGMSRKRAFALGVIGVVVYFVFMIPVLLISTAIRGQG